MYCPKCGNEVEEGALFCSHCGEKLIKEEVQTKNKEGSNVFLTVAFVFMIISTVTFGVFLIPLAWMIPMTIECYGYLRDNKKCSTTFAVCTLIFVSLVAGIFLLAYEDEPRN